MSHPRLKSYQTIKINWLCYGDNEILYYESETLKKRFTKQSNDKSCNSEIKSIVKINDNNKKISWGNVGSHRPVINVKKSCDSLGNLVHYGAWKIDPPQYKYAYLNHYITKSSEEYAEKCLRGDATYIIHNKTEYYEKRMDRYFSINNYSVKKISLLEKKLNTTLKKFIKKFYFQLKI